MSVRLSACLSVCMYSAFQKDMQIDNKAIVSTVLVFNIQTKNLLLKNDESQLVMHWQDLLDNSCYFI